MEKPRVFTTLVNAISAADRKPISLNLEGTVSPIKTGATAGNPEGEHARVDMMRKIGSGIRERAIGLARAWLNSPNAAPALEPAGNF